MRQKLPSLIIPVYLFACLLLGGSAQAVWGNLLLQLSGLAILLWAVATPKPMALAPHARPLVWLFVLLAALFALQLVPLPSAVWTALPGRAVVARDLQLLGLPLAAMPLSLDPYGTWSAALQLIPPAAIIAGIVRLGAFRVSWLIAALALGAIGGVLLGAAQVASPDSLTSPFYLYNEVNFGTATGFFANANHMGSLLLCTIPFLVAAIGRSLGTRGRSSRQGQGVVITAASALIVVLVGIALNRSLAVWMLTLPVLAASTIVVVRSRGVRVALIAIAATAVIAAPLVLRFATASSDASNAISIASRQEMSRLTLLAISENMPLGSGIGTFVRLYPQQEAAGAVGSTFVVHAHNDYFEVALEAGVPGLILLALFLLWFAGRSFAVWRGEAPEYYARAASIAAAALLLHSFVDYPLRTSALAGVFAMCVALLAEPRSLQRRRSSSSEDGQPAARHLSL